MTEEQRRRVNDRTTAELTRSHTDGRLAFPMQAHLATAVAG